MFLILRSREFNELVTNSTSGMVSERNVTLSGWLAINQFEHGVWFVSVFWNRDIVRRIRKEVETFHSSRRYVNNWYVNEPFSRGNVLWNATMRVSLWYYCGNGFCFSMEVDADESCENIRENIVLFNCDTKIPIKSHKKTEN